MVIDVGACEDDEIVEFSVKQCIFFSIFVLVSLPYLSVTSTQNYREEPFFGIKFQLMHV